MSLKSLINKAVSKAFKAVGDLAEDGELSNLTSVYFNFNTGEASSPLPLTAPVKITREVLVKSSEFVAVTTASYLVIKSVRWNIVDVVTSDNFTSYLKITRS
jgi:hypothetical protein